MRLLRSATTTSPAIRADGMSDIDNDSPSDIQREGRTITQKHPQKNKMLPQQNFIAGKIFLSEKVEGDSDDQYTQPEEIDSGVQNSNLLLTSDHEYTGPYERPSWGGMVVYLNTIMKWYGVTPQINLYFDKSNLSPKKTPPGLYLGNPNKTTMGSITVNRLKNLMKTRNFDVEVVTLPSILGSTEYKKELFLIQGYAQREKKLKNTEWVTRSYTYVESKKRKKQR
jgi:hypothetical protein